MAAALAAVAVVVVAIAELANDALLFAIMAVASTKWCYFAASLKVEELGKD